MASDMLEKEAVVGDEIPSFPLPPKGHALHLALAGRKPTDAEATVLTWHEKALGWEMMQRLMAVAGPRVLKALRKERKLTQVAMARALGICEYYLYRLEKGKSAISYSVLQKIAGWLKATEDVRLRQLRLRAKML